MADKAAIDEEAQTDKARGASDEELRGIFAAVLEAEINDIDSRRGHSESINPVVVSSAKDIRWMRRGIVVIAAVIPLVLLASLLLPVYSGLPVLINNKMEALATVEELAQKAEAISMLAAPLTALIIGTFASFVIVYTALLIGLFRGISGSSREKEPASGISSAAFDAIRKMTGNGS